MTGPDGPKRETTKESRRSSRKKSEIRYLAVGRIVRAHGVRGEVSMTVLTEFPERFDETEWVYLGDEFEATPYRLESFRWHKQNLLLILGGITDRSQAEQLRNQFVQVPVAEAVPLPEESYYLYQLVGLDVVTTTGEFLGSVVNILETGANLVYVVEFEGRELLLPDIPDVVKAIDIELGQITVDLIDGLI